MTFEDDQEEADMSTLLSLELAQRKLATSKQDVASARNNQARLENQIFELDQTLAEARKENQRLLRNKKDFDRQQEQNNLAFEQERAHWLEREAELVRSLKFATRPLVAAPPNGTLQHKGTRQRVSSMNGSGVYSNMDYDDRGAEGSEDDDSLDSEYSLKVQQQISDATATQTRALRVQEKLVSDLRAQVLTINSDMMERTRVFTIKQTELKQELGQVRELNRNLMEENESYQMLLHEKSMNGDFMKTDIMKNTGFDDMSEEPSGSSHTGSINLADELGGAFGGSLSQETQSQELRETIAGLREEVRTLKESNTALGLYISKILSRIMENPHLQAILQADYSPSRGPATESPSYLTKQRLRASNEHQRQESEVENNDNKRMSTIAPLSTESGSTATVKAKGRTRSTSLFGGSIFSRQKSSVESKASGSEAESLESSHNKALNFHDGHVVDEDSPRTSYSSAENGRGGHVLGVNDPSLPPILRTTEYEPLTTFDQPFSRRQLQRHATMSTGANLDRNERRKTVGGAFGTMGNGHGRVGSESSAQTNGSSASSTRRSLLLKAKPSLNILPETTGQFGPVPEIPAQFSNHSLTSSTASSPMVAQFSPALTNSSFSPGVLSEISTPVTDTFPGTTAPTITTSSLGLSSTVGTDSASTTPMTASTATPTSATIGPAQEGGTWRKVVRRMSLFGGGNSTNNQSNIPVTPTTAVFPTIVAEGVEGSAPTPATTDASLLPPLLPPPSTLPSPANLPVKVIL